MQRVGKRKREGDDAAGGVSAPAAAAVSTSTSNTGHYEVSLGENLSPRYKVLASLGQGTFARVLECWDRTLKDVVAVKVIRDIPKYRDASKVEIRILRRLAAADPDGAMHVVRLRHTFEYKNHVCLVYDRLGLSLFDMLRKNRFQPFSTAQIKGFATQLIAAVGFLHGTMQLVHTDLKPENILLCDPGYEKVVDSTSGIAYRIPTTDRIQVIDFGSAVSMTAAGRRGIICTRHYRAPEVILGLTWSYPVDMWSIGCILVELYTGRALFQTSDDAEHLAMIELVNGPMPRRFVERAGHGQRAQFFVDTPRAQGEESLLKKPSVTEGSREGHCAKLSELIEHEGLRDFLECLFTYDPAMRITAAEAAKHAFLVREEEPNKIVCPKEEGKCELEEKEEVDLTAEEEDLTRDMAAVEVPALAS